VTRDDITGRRRRLDDEEGVAAREADMAAVEAINRLFGSRQSASVVAPPRQPSAKPGHDAAARHHSHKYRHHRKSVGHRGRK